MAEWHRRQAAPASKAPKLYLTKAPPGQQRKAERKATTLALQPGESWLHEPHWQTILVTSKLPERALLARLNAIGGRRVLHGVNAERYQAGKQ